MKSIKVCEYSRSRSFHYDLILQDQASGERSQDQLSSGDVIRFVYVGTDQHLSNTTTLYGGTVFEIGQSSHNAPADNDYSKVMIISVLMAILI